MNKQLITKMKWGLAALLLTITSVNAQTYFSDGLTTTLSSSYTNGIAVTSGSTVLNYSYPVQGGSGDGYIAAIVNASTLKDYYTGYGSFIGANGVATSNATGIQVSNAGTVYTGSSYSWILGSYGTSSTDAIGISATGNSTISGYGLIAGSSRGGGYDWNPIGVKLVSSHLTVTDSTGGVFGSKENTASTNSIGILATVGSVVSVSNTAITGAGYGSNSSAIGAKVTGGSSYTQNSGSIYGSINDAGRYSSTNATALWVNDSSAASLSGTTVYGSSNDGTSEGAKGISVTSNSTATINNSTINGGSSYTSTNARGVYLSTNSTAYITGSTIYGSGSSGSGNLGLEIVSNSRATLTDSAVSTGAKIADSTLSAVNTSFTGTPDSTSLTAVTLSNSTLNMNGGQAIGYKSSFGSTATGNFGVWSSAGSKANITSATLSGSLDVTTVSGVVGLRVSSGSTATTSNAYVYGATSATLSTNAVGVLSTGSSSVVLKTSTLAGSYSTNADYSSTGAVGVSATDSSVVITGSNIYGSYSSASSANTNSTGVKVVTGAVTMSTLTVSNSTIVGAYKSTTGAVGLSLVGSVGNIYNSTIIGAMTGTNSVGLSLSNATLNFYSGLIEGDITGSVSDIGLLAASGSIVNMYGGDITHSTLDLDVLSSSTVYLYGSDFNYGFGSISDLTGTINGTLSDGSNVSLTFNRSASGQIILVETPEPNGALLVLGGVSMMLFFVRRRRYS